MQHSRDQDQHVALWGTNFQVTGEKSDNVFGSAGTEKVK